MFDRRKVLKCIGSGTIGLTGLAATATANDEESAELPPELNEVAEKYENINETEARGKYNRNVGKLFRLLSQPIDKIENLRQLLPKEIIEERQDGLIRSVETPAEFMNGRPDFSFHFSGRTPTAQIIQSRDFSRFVLSVAAEPEANREYAIIRVAEKYGGKNVIIDGDSVEATACIEDAACKKHYYKPCSDCVYQYKCLNTRLFCCQDYCYWGSDLSTLCSCPTCNNCEYWCSGGNCN